MPKFAAIVLLLSSCVLALAQQSGTYIYMFENTMIPAVAHNANIDGVTIPILQFNADSCGTTSCAAPPNVPPGSYTWPDTGSNSFGSWTTTNCGGTLRGTPSPCTVNIGLKSVANGGNNTWAPQYIFTQSWANYAAQQSVNQWQPNHFYPIGSTITCGVPACSSFYYRMTSSPSGGLCQSGSSVTFKTNGDPTPDNTCTWSFSSAAPLQDVIFDSSYIGNLPTWVLSTNYNPNNVIGPVNSGHYYKEITAGCTHSTTGMCKSDTSITWNTAPTLTCDNNCTWSDLGKSIVLTSGTTSDTATALASGMPAVWETPFSYAQQLFYQNALTHYAGVPRASQIQYIRTGVGVGEEASIAGAPTFETLLPYGTLTDAQMKGIWTNQALQIYSANATTMTGLSIPPSWVIMALINCGTGLATVPGVDCTWADVEAQGALAQFPFYGGYGSQGLQTSDLFQQQNIAQCQIPFQGKSCCSNNWCETRYYMTGKLPYTELQELCLSYFASGGSPTSCIYDQNYPNASLSQVLALATQHGTNVVELGEQEFECAYGSTCTSYTGAAAANAAAIQNAARGLPSSTTAIFGATGLLGLADIF